MIELFAIVDDGQPIEMYLKGKNKKMKSLLVTFLKTLKNNNESKLMKCMVNCDYYVYYFWQDNFLFILATQISDRAQRMKNYLRVVADIFYENYDERKFHIVLNKIMDQINKIQFGIKKPQQIAVQDEEMGLVSDHLVSSKRKLNKIISKRAFYVSVMLFLSIVGLAAYYLVNNWKK